MAFSADVSKWIAKVPVATKEIARGVAEEVFKRVKDRTPVDTGALQAAWTLEESGDVITVTNALPYAAVVEYGLYPNPPKGGAGKTTGGFSSQAPQGMVGVTLAEVPQIIEEVVSKL